MKSLLSILVVTVAFTSYAQTGTTATPAPATSSDAITEQPLGSADPAAPMVPAEETPAPAAAGATPAAPSAAATSTKAPAVKKVAKAATSTTAAPAPVKSPWSGYLIADVSRATDINHSKILDPENPDQRTDYSLAIIGGLKYKSSPKNAFSATQTVTKDFIRNSADPSATEYSVKNLRVGWTRYTDATILGSGKIGLPFSVALPTSYDARKAGSLASFRFKPVISWEIDPTWNLTFVSQTDATFTNKVDQEFASERVVENATLGLNNSLTLGANISDTLSISQTVGMTSKSKNLRNPLNTNQLGSSLDLSTGLAYVPTASFELDFAVSQSAPVQGDGAGAVQVYDNNLYKLYHVAQTSYGVTANYFF